MKKKLTIILAAVLALGLVVTACPGQSVTGPPEVGKLAPDFELTTLDGQKLSLSQFKGTPVLLNFWATWCGPCRHEMPFLQQVYQDWPTDELVVFTINVGESSSRVAQFMQSEGLSFPVLLDSNARVTESYYITGIPTTLFIDKFGFIEEIKIGSFQSQAEIEAILDRLT